MAWKQVSVKTTNAKFLKNIKKMLETHINDIEAWSLEDDDEIRTDMISLSSWLEMRTAQQFDGETVAVWEDE